MSIQKLKGRVKDYDWGRTDNANRVYEFSGQEWKEQKYAELWMGSHPSAPSLLGEGTLTEYLKAHNQPELTYLFKILSIQKCLSIQSHPSKSQAQELHTKFPNLYPDPNDKPQMFLTLTNFKCLMGFVGDEEVKQLIAQEPFTDFKSQNVKDALQEVLLLPKDEIAKRVRYVVENSHLFKGRQQFLKVANSQFPDDVGILVSLLLQYRELPPGEAYYIKAGQPHAYVEGQCLELMKNSDNVVRLGLTPKHKDTETLLRILDYDHRSIEKLEKHDGKYLAGELVLHEVVGSQEFQLTVPGIGIVLQGGFALNEVKVEYPGIFLIPAGKAQVIGKGRLYIATSL